MKNGLRLSGTTRLGSATLEHVVHLYQTDVGLAATVSEYFAAHLNNGGATVLIATDAHRRQIKAALLWLTDIDAAEEEGRYVALDAQRILRSFVVDGQPDPTLFAAVVGGTISRLTGNGEPLKAFGEMVALLWGEGRFEAALALERLWNDLACEIPFDLLCAYPRAAFRSADDRLRLRQVCAEHHRVVS